MTAPLTVVAIDHMLYLAERSYRRQILIRLRRLVSKRRASAVVLDVWHETDFACCDLEPWSATAARIWDGLFQDGIPVLRVVLDGDEQDESA